MWLVFTYKDEEREYEVIYNLDELLERVRYFGQQDIKFDVREVRETSIVDFS